MRNIDTIIIHCSDTPNAKHYTVQDIDDWHKQRGFKRSNPIVEINPKVPKHIGYHFVIYTNGPVVCGREIKEVGAHARGNNSSSIGVCLIGRDKFSIAQWESLKKLCQSLQRDFLSIKNILGHCELNSKKTCPNFNVNDWLANDMAPLTEHVCTDQKYYCQCVSHV